MIVENFVITNVGKVPNWYPIATVFVCGDTLYNGFGRPVTILRALTSHFLLH